LEMRQNDLEHGLEAAFLSANAGLLIHFQLLKRHRCAGIASHASRDLVVRDDDPKPLTNHLGSQHFARLLHARSVLSHVTLLYSVDYGSSIEFIGTNGHSH
jgi:hypothetical protein